MREPLAGHLHEGDEEQKQNLAIDARLDDVAAHPAVEAQVDKGGEGPDLFFLDGAADHADHEAEEHVKRQRQKFAVQDGGNGRTAPPSMAQPGPMSNPRRMTVSKEMSAARKLGTRNRSQTPIVSGTRKNASNPSVCAGRRFSAKSSRRNVVTRASTLATEAITPSFTSSVIQIRLEVTPSLYRGVQHQRENL